MSWNFLSKGIKDLIEADTGSGGLFEVGGTLKITGVFNRFASQTAALPYIVMFPVAATENKAFGADSVEYVIDFDIYTELRENPDLGGDIADRLRTVLDRQTPTLASGWTSDAMRQTSGFTVDIDDDRMVTRAEYEVFVTKG